MTDALNLPLLNDRLWHPRRLMVRDPLIIDTPAGRLGCVLRRVDDPAAPIIVHFHGNGEVAALSEEALWPLHRACGCHALYVEYPGYGHAEDDAPAPRLGLLLDSVPAILAAAPAPPSRVIVSGRSIGSLFAWAALAQVPGLAGVILDSAIADPATWIIGRLPADTDPLVRDAIVRAARQALNPRAILADTTCPVLALHTATDAITLIGPLHDLLTPFKKRATVQQFALGDHNTILPVNRAVYADALARWVTRHAHPGWWTRLRRRFFSSHAIMS